MAVEIERKFLVDHNGWHAVVKHKSSYICQGYLVNETGKNIRIRIKDQEAYLTIKGKAQGLARPEFEYSIPVNDARQMLDLFQVVCLEKTRYEIVVGNHTWEVDVFHGDNDRLIVAEIELHHEDEAFIKPDWIAAEVTHDPRYLNSNLIKAPYRTWED